MKDSIANVWLLGIMITFILLFSAYIIITVNYSASFKLKNEILNIIEKNRGMTNFYNGTEADFKIGNESRRLVTTGSIGTLQTINVYLAGSTYSATGQCNYEEYSYGVQELATKSDVAIISLSESTRNEKFLYCFSKYRTGIPGPYNSAYYKFRLFYKFEVPVLSEFLSIKVEGMTNEIYKPSDNIQAESDSFYLYSN